MEVTAVNSFWFLVGGLAVLCAGGMLVWLNKPVSTGHSLLFAIGATIVLLPYVASFEWSKDSIKFTTRDEVAVLARNAAAATRDEVQLRSQIAELAEGLKLAILRIGALEAAAGAEAPNENTIIDGWTPMTLDSWLRANEQAKAEAEQRIDLLQDLETQLTRPTPFQR